MNIKELSNPYILQVERADRGAFWDIDFSYGLPIELKINQVKTQ